MVSVNATRLRMHLQAKGMTISGLARAAGITRQAVHQMLRPGYRPLSLGVETVARALEVDPLDILYEECAEARRRREVEDLVTRAAAGDARAFEVLPATLLLTQGEEIESLHARDATSHQILAAAAEVAGTLSRRPWMERFIRGHASRVVKGQAFFFGTGLIGMERLMSLTPSPMRRHRVYGAFEMKAFARHCS